jgi:DNA-binding response OmpR family regulator
MRTAMSSIDAKASALLVSQDLFFYSKITSTANELGFRIDVEGDVAEVVSKLPTSTYRCLILDLSTRGLRVADIIGALPTANRPAVIAFGSHVLAARLNEAREAGCNEVMPRSKFSATLPEILARYLQVSRN